MNQTPAAILVLAAAVMSYASQAASMSSHHQSSVLLTICAVFIGVWGAISLAVSAIREREALIDSHARLDLLDRVLVREPMRTLKEVARPVAEAARPVMNAARGVVTGESRRPLEISSEVQARLNAMARHEGRDRSELLDELLRQHLPKSDSSHHRAA